MIILYLIVGDVAPWVLWLSSETISFILNLFISLKQYCNFITLLRKLKIILHLCDQCVGSCFTSLLITDGSANSHWEDAPVFYCILKINIFFNIPALNMLQLKSVDLFKPTDVHQSKYYAFVASFVLSLISIFLMCVLLAPRFLVYKLAREKGILPKNQFGKQYALCATRFAIHTAY